MIVLNYYIIFYDGASKYKGITKICSFVYIFIPSFESNIDIGVNDRRETGSVYSLTPSRTSLFFYWTSMSSFHELLKKI